MRDDGESRWTDSNGKLITKGNEGGGGDHVTNPFALKEPITRELNLRRAIFPLIFIIIATAIKNGDNC
jgi:hypothetical protein